VTITTGSAPAALQGGRSMGKLSAAERRALPASDFARPGKGKGKGGKGPGAFPIEDRGHAKAALSRAAHKGGSAEKEVRAKVARKYPGMVHAHHHPAE
jgi:hypothetical protein